MNKPNEKAATTFLAQILGLPKACTWLGKTKDFFVFERSPRGFEVPFNPFNDEKHITAILLYIEKAGLLDQYAVNLEFQVGGTWFKEGIHPKTLLAETKQKATAAYITIKKDER